MCEIDTSLQLQLKVLSIIAILLTSNQLVYDIHIGSAHIVRRSPHKHGFVGRGIFHGRSERYRRQNHFSVAFIDSFYNHLPLSDGKYELIDGRHRRRAVIKAGLPTTKCIIKTNLTDKEKQTIRLTSNLIRNNDYLPSELAFAYKELAELEDMKTISEETNLSKKKIYRYIRLTNLIEPLLNRVDGGSIPVIAAVELSYLTEQQQKQLFEFLLNHSDCKITTASARDIKEQPDNLYDVFYAVETTDSLPADDSKLDTEEPAEQESIRKLAEKAVEPYRRQDEASVTHDANSKTDSEESRNRNSRVQPQEVDNLSACCGSQRAFGQVALN